MAQWAARSAPGVEEPPGAAGEDQLRADAVRRRGQQPVIVEREEPGEGTERALHRLRAQVDSTAARRRSTTSSAFASETPASPYEVSEDLGD